MGSLLSVVLITRNEERHIARALRSVETIADETLVIDSESEDRTREIAREYGARVSIQPWLGWVAQKNYGASLAVHDWILFLDADEIVTPELAADIKRELSRDLDPTGGFAFERQDEFLGVLMLSTRRNKIKKRFIRLFNRIHSRWDEDFLIHEGVRCVGPVKFLNGKLLHWRGYSIDEQMTVFNKNAFFEAKMLLSSSPRGVASSTVVLKPILRFIWVYIACGNWRLGMRGFLWASMNAASEFLRQAKAWEVQYAPPAFDPSPPVYRQQKSRINPGSAPYIDQA